MSVAPCRAPPRFSGLLDTGLSDLDVIGTNLNPAMDGIDMISARVVSLTVCNSSSSRLNLNLQ